VAGGALIAPGRGRRAQELTGADLHGDPTRHALAQDGQPTLGRQEGEPRLADRDLVSLLQRVAGDRLAVDQGAVAAAGVDQDEAAVAPLDGAVAARHREIRELNDIVLAAPYAAPPHRNIEFGADVGSLDHHQAGQAHGIQPTTDIRSPG
jgi:hypothetical protein